MSDPRFARLQTDPRFRRPKQKQLKTEIDDRFKDVLSEDFGKIKGKARVDKRGRALASTSGADEMKRFYRLKSPEGDEEEKPVDFARGEGYLSSSGSEDGDSDDDESEFEEDVIEIGGKQRLRPHQLEPDSDSDSDDDGLKIDLSEDEGAINLDEDDEENEDDEEEEEGVDPTTRLAAVNLDWDNMRAEDLFILFNSFLTPVVRRGEVAPPPPGKLLSVKIYPSEFGKERMAKEDAAGPGGGIFKVNEKTKRNKVQRKAEPESSDEDDSEDEGQSGDEEDEDMSDDDEDEELEDDGLDAEIDNLEILPDVESGGEEDIDMDKLRQYQLERLRYYYAIATFSTVEAAQAVHDELNGSEFERTANILDLSYVPEDMTFADSEVEDVATKESKAYKGNEFVTDALRHSKVKLTWDQDDPNRAKMTRRALTREEIDDGDFGNLVAASSDDEVEEEEPEDEMPAEKKSKKAKAKERKDKLRALLLEADDENGDIWGKQGTAWQEELADLKGDKGAKEDAVEITFKPGLSKDVEDENLTSLERYKLRMKEKKREKKEKLELKRADKDNGTTAKPKDDFFGGSDSESEAEVETKPKQKGKAVKGKDAKGKNTKGKDAKGKAKPKAEKPADDTNLDGIVGDDVHHFSMKDVLAAEKAEKAGKKRSRKRKGKAGPDHVPELGPDGFKVDVSDPRFSAMYSEPSFALDPTHSKFTDIPANREILKKTREAHSAVRGGAANGVDGGDSKGLGDLVQSVKRKAEGSGRNRKRTRK